MTARPKPRCKDSPDLQLRIGIHLGDVLFTDDNAWGDGVNIASRIHALAVPGWICVSASVYDEIRNKPGMVAKNLGQKRLKNVSRPIGVYRFVRRLPIRRRRRRLQSNESLARRVLGERRRDHYRGPRIFRGDAQTFRTTL